MEGQHSEQHLGSESERAELNGVDSRAVCSKGRFQVSNGAVVEIDILFLRDTLQL